MDLASPSRAPSVDDLVGVFGEIDRVKVGHALTFSGPTATNECRMCKKQFRYLKVAGQARHACDDCTCEDIYAASSSNSAP